MVHHERSALRLLHDHAGWHTTPELVVPDSITLLLLPSRSPKLTPVESLSQYLRRATSQTACPTYEVIIEAACEAQNRLIDQPRRIPSIDMREWAHNRQIQ